MNELAVVEIGRESLWVMLVISAPVMIVGMVVGLIISLFQALTTIQEITLTFVPKILAIFVAIILFLPFMMTSLIEFSRTLFDRMVALG